MRHVSPLLSSPLLTALAALSAAASVDLSAQAPAQPCDLGAWEPGFDHVPEPAPNCVPPLFGGCTPNPPKPFFEVNPSDPCQARHFEAIHASLIPIGPDQGKLLVWGHIFYNPGNAYQQTRVLDWAIVDVNAKTMRNYRTCMPAGMGDLFCAGHAWLPDGKLLVVGGTEEHRTHISPVPPIPNSGPGPGNGWTGARLAYTYNPSSPPASAWQRLPDLEALRWYPSVVVLGRHPQDLRTRVAVVGGTNNGAGVNSYQAWDPMHPAAAQWDQNGPSRTFPGPTGSPDFLLYDYPRQFLLSTGLAVLAGMARGSTRMDHYLTTGPTYWQANDPTWVMPGFREYGTAVLFPISLPAQSFDMVLAIAGRESGGISGSVRTSPNAASNNPSGRNWVPFAPPNGALLNHPRWFANSVLLPDSTILVTGGERASNHYGCSTTPALQPELYRAGAWKLMAATTVVRDYHSTALLLPDGRVITTSGESRRFGPGTCPRPSTATANLSNVDYQAFSPPYLHCGLPRPVIRFPAAPGSALDWRYGAVRSVQYVAPPAGTSIASMALVRAGSVTHHCDPNQRVVNLSFQYVPPPEGGDPALQLTVPANSNLLPEGYYMLFLVDNHGTPSVATWVQVQQ